MNLKLLNIEQAINNYNHLYIEQPKFGMDVLSNRFQAQDIVILQNSKKRHRGSPVRCDFYTLVFCISGLSTRNINQFTYTIKANSLQLLPPRTLHSFEDTAESEYYVILFNKSLVDLREIMEFHNKHFTPIDLNATLLTKVKELYEEIDVEFKNKNINYLEYAKTLLTQIMILLYREKVKRVETKTYTKADLISGQFLNLVEENFLTMKSTASYAQVLQISAKHLGETIKGTLGKNSLDFIHKRIIKEAQYLLVYSSMNIYGIASYLNFSDSAQFSRFFKKHTGQSPKEYRINSSTRL
ncbi:MAG: helix-turn-helix domain-containing protein [Campylobacterales bacterium]|nr:helix-turn-helix domain-containing protein [Campylobacterales bacterium]